MTVDIVGEDEVTRAILRRLISDIRADISIDKSLPARGSQIKNLTPNYNRLNSPLILLTDLDTYDCPPSLIRDWLGSILKNESFIFRIAYGEAESWLMADRKGFSDWLGCSIDLIPHSTIIDKRKNIIELIFPYKPSLYLMREIASRSKDKNKKEGLMPKIGAKKGPLYNSTLIPYIETDWDFNEAANNSTSLQNTIQRISEFRG